MEIVPVKVKCGDVYLHGTEFSVRLRTPEPIFEAMQRVISKVLIAFDINCGSPGTFSETLEVLSRDIANEMGKHGRLDFERIPGQLSLALAAFSLASRARVEGHAVPNG